METRLTEPAGGTPLYFKRRNEKLRKILFKKKKKKIANLNLIHEINLLL